MHSSFYLSPHTVSIGLIGPGTVGGVLLDQIASQVERLAETRLPTEFGEFTALGYRDTIEQTGLRVQRKSSVYTPLWLPPPETEESPEQATLKQERTCYVCKQSFVKVHRYYDSMCEACGDFNYAKRSQTASLAGRTGIHLRPCKLERSDERADPAAALRRRLPLSGVAQRRRPRPQTTPRS